MNSGAAAGILAAMNTELAREILDWYGNQNRMPTNFEPLAQKLHAIVSPIVSSEPAPPPPPPEPEPEPIIPEGDDSDGE